MARVIPQSIGIGRVDVSPRKIRHEKTGNFRATRGDERNGRRVTEHSGDLALSEKPRLEVDMSHPFPISPCRLRERCRAIRGHAIAGWVHSPRVKAVLLQLRRPRQPLAPVLEQVAARSNHDW
jgi:hypothetical protein